MKRTAIGHTKLRRLARTLSVPQYAAGGLLEFLWHLTAREAPRGDIGRLTDDDIADALGWEGDPAVLIEALTETGWLDPSGEHRLLIHDWPDHAEDAVQRHLARQGLDFADGTPAKTTRLNPQERAELAARQAQQAQKSAQDAPTGGNESTGCARNAHAVRDAMPKPCLSHEAVPEPGYEEPPQAPTTAAPISVQPDPPSEPLEGRDFEAEAARFLARHEAALSGFAVTYSAKDRAEMIRQFGDILRAGHDFTPEEVASCVEAADTYCRENQWKRTVPVLMKPFIRLVEQRRDAAAKPEALPVPAGMEGYPQEFIRAWWQAKAAVQRATANGRPAPN